MKLPTSKPDEVWYGALKVWKLDDHWAASILLKDGRELTLGVAGQEENRLELIESGMFKALIKEYADTTPETEGSNSI